MNRTKANEYEIIKEKSMKFYKEHSIFVVKSVINEFDMSIMHFKGVTTKEGFSSKFPSIWNWGFYSTRKPHYLLTFYPRFQYFWTDLFNTQNVLKSIKKISTIYFLPSAVKWSKKNVCHEFLICQKTDKPVSVWRV